MLPTNIVFFANLNLAQCIQENSEADDEYLLDVQGWIIEDYYFVELREDADGVWYISVFDGRFDNKMPSLEAAWKFIQDWIM